MIISVSKGGAFCFVFNIVFWEPAETYLRDKIKMFSYSMSWFRLTSILHVIHYKKEQYFLHALFSIPPAFSPISKEKFAACVSWSIPCGIFVSSFLKVTPRAWLNVTSSLGRVTKIPTNVELKYF